MTEGLDVLVQLVIAAMTTDPDPTAVDVPSISTGTLRADGFTGTGGRDGACASFTVPPSESKRAFSSATDGDSGARNCCGNAARNWSAIIPSGTRSCGRRGPARLGSTVERSNSIDSENVGAGVASVRNSPCSLA